MLQPATAERRLRAHAFDWESCEEALNEVLGGAGGGVQRKRGVLLSVYLEFNKFGFGGMYVGYLIIIFLKSENVHKQHVLYQKLILTGVAMAAVKVSDLQVQQHLETKLTCPLKPQGQCADQQLPCPAALLKALQLAREQEVCDKGKSADCREERGADVWQLPYFPICAPGTGTS